MLTSAHSLAFIVVLFATTPHSSLHPTPHPPRRMPGATWQCTGHILCYFSPQTRAHSTQPSLQNAPPAHQHQHRQSKHTISGLSFHLCPTPGQLRAQQMVTCRQCTLPALPQTSQHREGAAAVMKALLCTEPIAAQPSVSPFAQRVEAEQLQQKS